ncbi:helix-turn-helix transcriptional regulator [Staphylococcus gallinarum]|jgi:transcriptional regulator with XRE-family HTH domain|uniref:XRE family transcriptional regulator n=3 Tax=Staphylococcus gallinarum TaxID=1293 RepID=A0A2T4SWI2_STAGA|nr:helix-turn-helix transcriptional regulator [Staphylococcus gallinarum]HIW39052.1 helix-turn-helix domain-containing protein [Candidatus Jeotgalicoccus stercoravium]MCD8821229.1 helix-turn-helix domain-containing protein [Staphylococcus gallinarum]MCD8872088.1 helix-turn-helix domain-containing protein [Staphylococcus gallinarum]MCQ9288766.1 helix-turn-helix domain-containing protein [Staphylococcus gallinarum]MDN6413711.1 helix-turn-helix transcriptional regulator [Staphylococcus gallinarum
MTQKSARKIFSENLLSLLHQKGIDQKQLAMDLGISPASVTHWIKENKYPRIGKIEEIAEYFNVPMSRLTQDQSKTEINQQDTIAAHFDKDGLTEDEIEEVNKFIEWVKNRDK